MIAEHIDGTVPKTKLACDNMLFDIRFQLFIATNQAVLNTIFDNTYKKTWNTSMLIVRTAILDEMNEE